SWTPPARPARGRHGCPWCDGPPACGCSRAPTCRPTPPPGSGVVRCSLGLLSGRRLRQAGLGTTGAGERLLAGAPAPLYGQAGPVVAGAEAVGIGVGGLAGRC